MHSLSLIICRIRAKLGGSFAEKLAARAAIVGYRRASRFAFQGFQHTNRRKRKT